MKAEKQLEILCKVMNEYWDRLEFYCATHPVPIPPVASGVHLDALGALFCFKRKENENDDEFRKRISASVVVTT